MSRVQRQFQIFQTALREIAAYNDEEAEQHRQRTGKWSRFDEPAAAQRARKALGDAEGEPWEDPE